MRVRHCQQLIYLIYGHTYIEGPFVFVFHPCCLSRNSSCISYWSLTVYYYLTTKYTSCDDTIQRHRDLPQPKHHRRLICGIETSVLEFDTGLLRSTSYCRKRQLFILCASSVSVRASDEHMRQFTRVACLVNLSSMCAVVSQVCEHVIICVSG